SMALSVSDIPFQGPIAGVNVGYVDGEYVINPNLEQKAQSRLDLEVAGHKDAINMVEAGASEITEAEMLDAILFGHQEIQRLCAFQEEIIAHIQPEKHEFVPAEKNETLIDSVKAKAEDYKLNDAIQTMEKQAREANLDAVKEALLAENMNEKDPENKELLKEVNSIINPLIKGEVRRLFADEKVGPDAVAYPHLPLPTPQHRVNSAGPRPSHQ
ncbi:hypothetical protein ACED91_11990, partial [Staphylococcus chromogenes]